MTDIATNLNTIDGSLSDIKTAIVNKGGTVSGNITTYATSISNIPSGGSSGKYQLLDRVTDDSNNEIGTVSGFFVDANNVEYAVVCLDAQYRSTSKYDNVEKDSRITNYTNEVEALKSRITATENTTYNLGNDYPDYAANYCRSLSFTINSTVYYGQLPNLKELVDIMQIYTNINSSDTSASQYSELILSNSIYFLSSNANGDQTWILAPDYFPCQSDTSGFTSPVLEIPNTTS